MMAMLKEDKLREGNDKIDLHKSETARQGSLFHLSQVYTYFPVCSFQLKFGGYSDVKW